MRKHFLIIASVCMALSTLVLTGCEKEDKDAISMSEATKGAKPVQGKDGKDYMVVDLGIPGGLLWATCNIGAKTPDEAGTFFAWGETEPKASYGYDNYKWCNGAYNNMTKYTTDNDHTAGSNPDSQTVLLSEDDAARQILGDGWRIPSKKQFTDMIYRCNYRECKLDGTWGYLFTSKENGNTIFIPLAGCRDYEDLLHNGKWGFYWTTELNTSSCNESYVLWLQKEANPVATKLEERNIGLPIRAVYKRPID